MKKRVLKIAILAIMIVLACVNIANALSFTATMTPSATTVPEATEFTVSIKISNLDVGTNGINAISGYLRCDKNIFEEINESSIDGISGWNATYTPDSGKITLTKATFVKTEEEVMNITFKTKAGIDAKAKPGKIEFKNIVASNSETSISAADISTEISIGTEVINNGSGSQEKPATNSGVTIKPTTNSNGGSATITANVVENKTNTASNVASNKTTNSVKNSTNSTNSTKNTVGNATSNNVNQSSEEDIPYTGVEDTIIYVIAAVVLVAIIFYIKFERINKEIK